MHLADRPRSHPTGDLLDRFHHLQSLGPDERVALTQRLKIRTANRGECLVEPATTADTTLYLLEGKLELRARDGRVRIIDARDAAARMPISRLRPSPYSVIALTPVRYLHIDNRFLSRLPPLGYDASTASNESYLVEETNSDDTTGVIEQRISGAIFEDLQRGRSMLRSLPQVGEAVGRAVLAAGNDERQIVGALMGDPVLAGKVVQAANRAFGIEGVATVTHAVRLLGPKRTASATVRWVLGETLRGRNPVIQAALYNWWQESLRVSASARTLARLNERFDPDLAATAGLLDRIGEAVLLCYANALEQDLDADTLHQLLAGHTREITRLILAMGHYGARLRDALSTVVDPTRPRSGTPDYGELLILARQCAQFKECDGTGHCYDDLRPLMKRLGLGEPSPRLCREVVVASKAAIARVLPQS